MAIQDLILLIHGCVWVLIYCIKDDSIYTPAEQKRLRIATWIIGMPYVVFIVIMSVYLAQRNY